MSGEDLLDVVGQAYHRFDPLVFIDIVQEDFDFYVIANHSPSAKIFYPIILMVSDLMADLLRSVCIPRAHPLRLCRVSCLPGNNPLFKTLYLSDPPGNLGIQAFIPGNFTITFWL